MTKYTDMTPDYYAQIVSQYYEPLYRFALSLTRAEADARDLTQQTFYIWAVKGHQQRDDSKAKCWLFTTLRRKCLSVRKKCSHLAASELNDEEFDLAAVSPEVVNSLEAERLIELLDQIKEPYRSAITLFYMEEYSCKEMAAILEVPLGTVQSRISRGIGQLQRLILMDADSAERCSEITRGNTDSPVGVSIIKQRSLA
jgi:RNA polymerase sigma-70 factor (ECF subfamily)